MDYNKCLIYRALTSKSEYIDAVNKGINGFIFMEEKTQKVWDFITDFHKNYKEIPSMELFEKTFPDYSLMAVKEPASYYADKILEVYARNKATQMILESASKLTESPIDGLINLRSQVNSLSVQIVKTQDVNIVDDPLTRFDKYELRKTTGGVDGISTPFDTLTEMTGGWHGEELIVVVARPGVGKSWFLMICAEHAFSEGKKVLFLTKEMSAEQMARRFDAVSAKIPYKGLKSGMLTGGEEQRYTAFLKDLASKPAPFWIVGQEVMTVSGLRAKIEQYNPDIVFLDGMYLMQGENMSKNTSLWERVTGISRELKATAQAYNIPIIVSTQFNRQGETKKNDENLSLASIGYADSIGQDADAVFGLVRTKDLEYMGRMKIKPLKVREAVVEEIVLKWDLENMDFIDITEECAPEPAAEEPAEEAEGEVVY